MLWCRRLGWWRQLCRRHRRGSGVAAPLSRRLGGSSSPRLEHRGERHTGCYAPLRAPPTYQLGAPHAQSLPQYHGEAFAQSSAHACALMVVMSLSFAGRLGRGQRYGGVRCRGRWWWQCRQRTQQQPWDLTTQIKDTCACEGVVSAARAADRTPASAPSGFLCHGTNSRRHSAPSRTKPKLNGSNISAQMWQGH